MAKEYGIQNISSRHFARLDWYMKTARRLLRWVREIISPLARDPQSHRIESGGTTDNGHRQLIDFHGDRVELDKLLQQLSIGGRVQIMCDDGVLIAEKASQTQFELVHTQPISRLVH